MSNVSLVNGHIDRPKMTDEEIIKALELLVDRARVYRCENVSISKKTLEKTFDLINRQKAEIKKKDIEIDILIRKNETLKDEIAEVKSESKPKQGKWLINPDGYYPYCSECKEEPEGRKMTKFCPECGVDMRSTKRRKAESDGSLQ